ncbi:MAG: phosphotransferase [Bacteroidota bacterium]
MNRTFIIADNLVNDYCGQRERYLSNNVHIGEREAEFLFGADEAEKTGPVPLFLKKQLEMADSQVIFLRDSYDPSDEIDLNSLERLGQHCVVASSGEEFVPTIKKLVNDGIAIDGKAMVFPFGPIRKALRDFTGIDIGQFDPSAHQAMEVRFLLIGFHTERRIFSMANALRNLFGFEQVAVFSHFMGSANKEAHYKALQYQYPDNFIQVLTSTSALAAYLGQNLSYLSRFGLESVRIEPKDLRNGLASSQQKIIETICMPWTEVHLKALGNGYSGSLLLLADGKQGTSKTEPKVLKIDEHFPIRLEIKGYNRVKNFLGKHIPAQSFPVTSGKYSGIGMELASMGGTPSTLQELLLKVASEESLNAFLKTLDQVLSLLSERLYNNTRTIRRIAPYRHFKLHLAQQAQWLDTNLKNIQAHPNEEVFVSGEAVRKIFDVIRKNNDVVLCDTCLAHGDLNLANILSDNKGNIWTIDWTYTRLHPIATDFAKLENDFKFVVTGELCVNDLAKLQLLEEYLLNTPLPVPVYELPDHLDFVRENLQFKKIYLPVRELRMAYFQLQGEEDWLIYKIALLRFSLHTLSFDQSLDQGECGPAQLWYALVSVEILLFLLVGDDFHLKIRSERPVDYPTRFRIPIDQANWKVDCKDYQPPYYTAAEVLENDRLLNPKGEADPEDQWNFEVPVTWGREFVRGTDSKPLNPSGRTGIEGRGSLWLWGSNPMLFLCPIFYNKETGTLECLMNINESGAAIISVHFRRGESFQEAIIRSEEKINFQWTAFYHQQMHEGYFYDHRQTDHAWVDAKAYSVFITDESILRREQSADFKWRPVNHQLINGLHSNYANLLRNSLKELHADGLFADQHILNILEKTA